MRTCDCFGDLTGVQSTHTRSSGYECCDFCGHPLPGQTFAIRPIFAWYDMWIGVFWDRQKRRLYVLPLPCIGIVIQLPPKPFAGWLHKTPYHGDKA